MRDDTATECPEVIGKVVKSLKISQGRLEGTEVHLDFVDGTTLSVSVTPIQKTEASLLICGAQVNRNSYGSMISTDSNS